MRLGIRYQVGNRSPGYLESKWGNKGVASLVVLEVDSAGSFSLVKSSGSATKASSSLPSRAPVSPFGLPSCPDATAKPIALRELDRDGTGLEEGDTREDMMLREFIFVETLGRP